MIRNKENNSYKNNCGGRDGQRSRGGQTNEQGGKSQQNLKKKGNFKNKDMTEKFKAVMTYKLGKCGENMTTKFKLY